MNGIIATHKMRKELIPALLKQVKANELTVAEAAQCLADAQFKIIKKFNGNTGVDHNALLDQAAHDIESRLPEYTGIIVGRHI